MGTGAKDVRIGAVVLAAGGSLRMGQPKQLLPVGGRPMVRLVTEVAVSAGLAQIVVVIGAHAEAVRAALAGLPVGLVLNEAWADGLSSSVRAGLRALDPGTQAALLVLGDQPALTADLLRLLVDRYLATGAPIVAPFYEGQRGNPVLFDRALFSELSTVEGDRGGRILIDRYQGRVERVDVEDAAVIMDIDSPQDYEGILGDTG